MAEKLYQSKTLSVSVLERGVLRVWTAAPDGWNYTYYLKPTEEHNALAGYDQQRAEQLLAEIEAGRIDPYRIIKEKTRNE